MKKKLAFLFAVLILLLFNACSSVEDTVGQVGSWSEDSLGEIISQASDGTSIPALGGFGVDVMVDARLNALNHDNTEDIAAARMEEILEAIENQDSDTIYDMFSLNAQGDMKNFQEGTEYLFSLVEEEIESWERTGGSQDISTSHGTTTKKYSSNFSVNTNNHQYIFIIKECLADDTDTNNIGLYSIIAREKTDANEPTHFTECGIYVPEQVSDNSQ